MNAAVVLVLQNMFDCASLDVICVTMRTLTEPLRRCLQSRPHVSCWLREDGVFIRRIVTSSKKHDFCEIMHHICLWIVTLPVHVVSMPCSNFPTDVSMSNFRAPVVCHCWPTVFATLYQLPCLCASGLQDLFSRSQQRDDGRAD